MALGHALHRLAAAEKIAGHVGGQYLVDALGGKLLDTGLLKQNAGVVDQCVDRAKGRVQRHKHRHHLAFVSDIRPQCQRPATQCLNLSDNLLRRRFIFQIVNAHRITLSGQ
ncbi:hypothetical protein D3C86_1857420 [compost metagenome]